MRVQTGLPIAGGSFGLNPSLPFFFTTNIFLAFLLYLAVLSCTTNLRTLFPTLLMAYGDSSNMLAPLLPPQMQGRYSVAPSGQIATTPRLSAEIDTINPFYDWWTHTVGLWSWFEKSTVAIWKAFNEVLSDGDYPPTIDASLYQKNIIRCSDLWLVYQGEGCTTTYEVTTVLRCYINAVQKGEIPEFVLAKGDAVIQGIIKNVSNCSQVSYWRTRLILYLAHDLYHAKPSLVNVAIIYPLSVDRAKHNNATTQDEDTLAGWFNRASSDVGGALSVALDVVTWVAVAALAGLVIWGGIQLYSAYDEASR